MKTGIKRAVSAVLIMITAAAGAVTHAQRQTSDNRRADRRGTVRAVTIPVTVSPRDQRAPAELQFLDSLRVLEDGEQQEVISIRGSIQSPLSLAVLIQDDVVTSIANEISGIASFIRRLPPGSRVLVGYIRAGSLQVRQRFTTDLERAAKALRIPLSSPTASPYNPYVLTLEALKRFEAQPVGRRAVLLISDGLDLSRGFSSSTPSQSSDLQRAISEAQRRSVAVYSIYAPAVGSTGALVGNAQGSLQRLSDETGGRAFFQGASAPVSFDPFLRELNTLLARQLAITYLSTHPNKGFHRVQVQSDPADGDIRHPAGYTR